MKVNEKSIRKVLKKWRPRLGLDGRWIIEVRLYGEGNKWPKSRTGELAFVEPEIGYFKATININGPAFEQFEDTIEEVVVHELNHLVAWPMSIVARDALGKDHEATWEIMMEQMIETFTRAMLYKPKHSA